MEPNSIQVALDLLIATIAELHPTLATHLAQRLDTAGSSADASEALKQDLAHIAAQLRNRA